jgi:O-antigen/teichoic acid export membrane protein
VTIPPSDPPETAVGPLFPPAVAPNLGVRSWAHLRHALSLVRLKPFQQDTPDGRSKERYRRIALTTLSGLVVRGMGTLMGLVTVPLVLGYLGKERFGLWSTITTVVAWVALFDFGIANGLVNCIARAHGRDDRDEAARYVSTALALLLGTAAVLAAALALGARMVPWSSLLAVRGAVDDGTVRWSVVAALGMFLLGLPLSVVPQIYAGYQRSYVANGFAMLGMLAGFAALLLALRAEAGMPALVVAFGVGAVLASALGLGHALGVGMPWLRAWPAVSGDALREIMRRSAPVFLYQVGALAVNETQAIVLAHRCDLGVVAEYAILMRVYLLVLGLIQMGTASFVPSFREAQERGDHAWVRASFGHFVRVRTALAGAAGVVLVVAGNPLLGLWLPGSGIAFTPGVWATLAVVMTAVAWTTAHSDLLSILDRLWVLVALALANGAVTIALTYWLAPAHRVLGAVLSMGAVAVVAYSWIVPWVSRSVLGGGRGAR